MLPRVAVPPVAVVIIGAEALSVVLLLSTGAARQIGYALALALALLCAFTLFLLITLWRGSELSCSCFGGTDETVSAHDVVRNTALIAAIALAWSSESARPDDVAARPDDVGPLVIAVLALTNLATIVFLLRYRGPGNQP